jgi:hypothetical protein
MIAIAVSLALAAAPAPTTVTNVEGVVRDRSGRDPDDVCEAVYANGKGGWWMRLVRDQNQHGVPAYSPEREAAFTYCAGYIAALKRYAPRK